MISLIPNSYQLISSIGATAGFYMIGKLIFMIIYEIKYGNGAGELYLEHGKNYFHRK